MLHYFTLLTAVATLLPVLATTARAEQARRVIALDGVWQIAEGKMDAPPMASEAFARTVPVPGLVSLATPAFVEPGPKVQDRKEYRQKDPRRDAFWYRRTFKIDGAIPAVAKLKVSKAMFGTRVFLNGKSLGEHRPCFTPGYFDAKDCVEDRRERTAHPRRRRPRCRDRRRPVRLRLREDPVHSRDLRFRATDPLRHAAHRERTGGAGECQRRGRVQAKVRNAGQARKAALTFTVREAKSGKVVGKITTDPLDVPTARRRPLTVRVPISGCRLWSPEDPFLYTLEAQSGADAVSTRFGMRTFKLDPGTGRAMLNGRPYFMRGSNITLYRFFEDSECGNLPWRKEWVRTLHQRVKDMHWNCLRYCIGFPPEAWYDIADEEGILIQDEFPIWCGGSGWPRGRRN